MAPKKGYKREEESRAERGKRKQVVKGYESSSEDVHVPKGFAKISLRKWVESKCNKSMHSATSRSAVRVLRGSGETMPGLPLPTADSKSNKRTQAMQTPLKLRRSTRLASSIHSSCKKLKQSPYLEKSEDSSGLNSLKENSADSVSNTHPLCFSNSSMKEPVTVQPNTKDQPKENSADSVSNNQPVFFDNFNTKEPVPVQPNADDPPKENSADSPSNSQPLIFNNSSTKEPVQPMPVFFSNFSSVTVPEHPNTEDEGRAHSITLTEIARAEDCNSYEEEVEYPALVTVAGCRVKPEFAPTARIIENMHGDILAGSSIEGTLRSNLLENVCALYQKLEKARLTAITVTELELMRKDARDLLKFGVGVGWLAKRLDEIHHAKEILIASRNMKLLRIKKQERISELDVKVLRLQAELQDAEREREYEKEDAARIREEHLLARNEVMRFYNKSLVEGIHKLDVETV